MVSVCLLRLCRLHVLFDPSEMVCTRTPYNMVWSGRLCIRPTELPEALKRKANNPRVRESKKRYGTSIPTVRKSHLSAWKKATGRGILWLVSGPLGNLWSFPCWRKKTRIYLAFRISGRTSAAVLGCMNTFMMRMASAFHRSLRQFTMDNGSEFADFAQIEDWRTKVFFTRPYTTWERPQNERRNGLFRAFTPKAVSIDAYIDEDKRYVDAGLSYTGIDRHAEESIGLYSTVLTRQDYDMMAGQLVHSEEAPIPSLDDVPDTPYFDMDPSSDKDDEEIPEPYPQPQFNRHTGRGPIVSITIRQKPVPPSHSTYHPAFAPPLSATPERSKAVPQMDVSDIVVGSVVVHKAFGTGVVQSIEKGLIVVAFDSLEKKFQFPGAFQQGFLGKA